MPLHPLKGKNAVYGKLNYGSTCILDNIQLSYAKIRKHPSQTMRPVSDSESGLKHVLQLGLKTTFSDIIQYLHGPI